MLKKALAIVLTFTMLFSVCAISASALTPAAASETEVTVAQSASFSDQLSSYFYYFVDRLLNWLLSYMNLYAPKQEFVAKEDYVPVDFYEGLDEFDTSAKVDGQWSVGYSSASLIEGQNITDGEHYIVGAISLEPRACTGVIDDQRVRTYAISDGSDGIVVHAVLDAYALCSGDVLAIRELLKDYAEENNIISINVSVLHQHSVIDTLGINGDLLKALVQNSAVLEGAIDDDLVSGRNPEFMEHVRQTVALSIKNAVEDMKTGQLFYGTADATDLITDKRDPQVFDSNFNRLRFVPDSESAPEIWIVSAGIHFVSFGTNMTEVTGDVPYYLDQYVKENANANLVYVQGAQLALTANKSTVSTEENTTLEKVQLYAAEVGRRLMAIDNEELVSPLLNIKFKQIYLPIDNQILTLCADLGIYDATVVDIGDGNCEMVTEIGYMELGDDLAVFLAPGELEPAIAYGGAISADDSWNGQSWDYPSMQDYIADSGRKLLVFGFMNDEIGYILTDNDYRSILTENEEINTTSGAAGSTIMENFMALYDSINVPG